MRIVSWNVNGIRAAMAKSHLDEWLKKTRPDIVGLQEVRAMPEQIQAELARLSTWSVSISSAQKKGYSGVGLLCRKAPDSIVTTLGDDAFDAEGRVQIARFGKLTIVNVYVPNGGGKERDNSRIPFKIQFSRRLFDLLEREKKYGARILVMGDMNVAPEEIDLARPKENVKTAGFTPIERSEIRRWFDAGWTDTFRQDEKGPGHYSWWSQRAGVREKNIGWRIDLVLASAGAMPFVKKAFIEKDVLGSDHCPVGVEVDDAILL